MKKIMFNDKYYLTKSVLDGCKTMTRRIVPKSLITDWYENYDYIYTDTWAEYAFFRSRSPYKVGEVLAIAQSYSQIEDYICHKDGYSEVMALKETSGWNNKMFVKSELLPHYIYITDIKVERLQDISDEDCLNEGIIELTDIINSQMEDVIRYTFENSFENHAWKSYATPREAFAALIDKVSGKGTWEKNPWVYAYTFELVDKLIG